MDNQRLFLYGALGLLLLLIWQTWQADYGPRAGRDGSAPVAAESQVNRATPETQKQADDTPSAPVAEARDRDASASQGTDQAAGDQQSTATDASTAVSAPAKESSALESGQSIRVTTDLFDATISSRGGDLRSAQLRNYMEDSGGEQPVALLTNDNNELFVAQSGLQSSDHPAPSHHAMYEAESDQYRLAQGEDTLTVPLTWQQDGIRVTKTYTFHRGSYVTDVSFHIENTTDQPWVGRQYRQFQRRQLSDDDKPYMTRAFYGPVYYNKKDKYEQKSVEDLAESPLDETFDHGWAGVVEHYFEAAWLPEPTEKNTYYTKMLDQSGRARYLIGLYSPSTHVAAGSASDLSTRLYIGPKSSDQLAGLVDGLPLTIDYGYLGFLSAPLFTVLDWIHSVVGNWGLAIILLTVLIKLVFYKLSEKSYVSMAKMRQAQPKIQQLKERFGDDREKMGRAMMDLYKSEKINPLGGCLPIVVQIPVFIALYWMLRGSVELRNADFMLWITDLSARDPYYVLPILMGVSMWAQQKLNPTPVDSMQQKMFMALPFVFTFFFMFFPAGLVLYWLTNNILSIAQQYYITHHVVGEKGKDKGKGKGNNKGKGGPPAREQDAPTDEASGETKVITDESGDHGR